MIRHYSSPTVHTKNKLTAALPATKQSGFTIVELIIVVIVIGILVAITVVSYAAVTENAKKQTAKTDAQTVATALNKYKADNGAYPSDLSDVSSTTKVESTFQYSYNSTDDTFCLTASVKGASAFVKSSNTLPQEGGCPGHGVNGDAPITNLAMNPSAEAGTLGVSGYFGSPITRESGGAADGNYVFSTVTNDGTTHVQGMINTITTTAKENQAYTCSLSIKGTPGKQVALSGRFYTSMGGYITENVGSKTVTLSSSWQRVTLSFTTNPTTGVLYVQSRLLAPASGVTIQEDAIMCTEGNTTYNYADGNSAGWIWNGTKDASSSTGPVL